MMKTQKLSKLTTPIAVTAIAGLALAGCSSGDVSSAGANGETCEETYTIGYSNPFSDAAAVKVVINGVKAAAAERGCINLLIDNTTSSNQDNQRDTLESWVTQKVDAIVVLPVNAVGLQGLMEKAQAQGTKWVTYASPMDGADGLAGFDSVKSGTLIGDSAVEWIKENRAGEDVQAAVLSFTPSVDLAGRWEIPTEKLKAAGVDIVSTQDCAAQQCGLEIAESLLQANPDLSVVIAFNDDAALGASKAFANAGVDLSTVFIAGQDGGAEALKAVEGGTLYATAAINFESLSEAILDSAVNAITGEGETDLAADTVLASQDSPEVVREMLDILDRLSS